MSPTNKKKLNQIRIKLDKLDNDLLKLIKKRSSLVNEVLKVKIHKKEISFCSFARSCSRNLCTGDSIKKSLCPDTA